jgi:hypothetical protein
VPYPAAVFNGSLKSMVPLLERHAHISLSKAMEWLVPLFVAPTPRVSSVALMLPVLVTTRGMLVTNVD